MNFESAVTLQFILIFIDHSNNDIDDDNDTDDNITKCEMAVVSEQLYGNKTRIISLY